MPKIFFYGKSIFISGMKVRLQSRFGVTTIAACPRLPEADFIFVDLCEEETVRALPKLSVLGIPLAGVNPARGTMMSVIFGYSRAAASAREMAEVLSEAFAAQKKFAVPAIFIKKPNLNSVL